MSCHLYNNPIIIINAVIMNNPVLFIPLLQMGMLRLKGNGFPKTT